MERKDFMEIARNLVSKGPNEKHFSKKPEIFHGSSFGDPSFFRNRVVPPSDGAFWSFFRRQEISLARAHARMLFAEKPAEAEKNLPGENVSDIGALMVRPPKKAAKSI